MGHRLIRQPNGKLARWSTIVDYFLDFDIAEEEAYLLLIREYGTKAAASVRRMIDRAAADSTLEEWKACLRFLACVCGVEEARLLMTCARDGDWLPLVARERTPDPGPLMEIDDDDAYAAEERRIIAEVQALFEEFGYPSAPRPRRSARAALLAELRRCVGLEREAV